MARNTTKTVAEYLKSLEPDRRKAIEDVRAVIRRRLPKGYEELMTPTGITYAVPLARFPDTYNGQPLYYAALASQKNYCVLYLMTVYGHAPTEAKFRKAFKDAGKKLDMGKSCVRFKTVDDLALDAVGDVIASTPPDRYIAFYEQSRPSKPKPSARKRPGRT